MTDSVAAALRDAACKVVGVADGQRLKNIGEERVLLALVEAYRRDPEATIYFEPSLARRPEKDPPRPPDLVLTHPQLGLHVFEVKAHELAAVEYVNAGEFGLRTKGRVKAQKPFDQAARAMFDIKSSVERATGQQELVVPFDRWVVMANIAREEWLAKWGRTAVQVQELLFRDDLTAELLTKLLLERGQGWLKRKGVQQCSKEHFAAIRVAFGDSSVLYDETRVTTQAREGTLGDLYNERATQDKRLSDEQQRLSSQDWIGGPRLVRGVAGSGKTVVLANNMARLLPRYHSQTKPLFGTQITERRRVAAVCFNRTLVPFIREKLDGSYRQRTGQQLFAIDGTPPMASAETALAVDVEVMHFNRLLYELSRKGACAYRRVTDEPDAEKRARLSLAELQRYEAANAERFRELQFDAIYVDEAQDLCDDEFRVLTLLCRRTQPNDAPNIFVFYDDAQNLYGNPRPVWESVGIKVQGGSRSHVMTECFRNTRQIVEPAFNVLLGAVAPDAVKASKRQFADTYYLEKEKRVIERSGDYWRVKFAERVGDWPTSHFAASKTAELQLIRDRFDHLRIEEQVRPEDILVIVPTMLRGKEIASALRAEGSALELKGVIEAYKDEAKDSLIRRPGFLTVSTPQSAKGYDAFHVLIASCNEFNTASDGRDPRAMFYVACTRAREQLEVFAWERAGLAREFDTVVRHLSSLQDAS